MNSLEFDAGRVRYRCPMCNSHDIALSIYKDDRSKKILRAICRNCGAGDSFPTGWDGKGWIHPWREANERAPSPHAPDAR